MPLAPNGHSDGFFYERNPRPKSKFVGLSQAYELRQLAFDEAKSVASIVAITVEERIQRARALQALGSLWTDASDRIRILRGRPLPGSLRPERKPKPQRTPSIRVKPARETAPASDSAKDNQTQSSTSLPTPDAKAVQNPP